MLQSDRNGHPHTHLIAAASAGQIAIELLSVERRGFLYGISSRGLYIKTDTKWLSFISLEKFRGPLTITLSDTEGIIEGIPLGAPLEISSGRIHFPEVDLTISVREVEIWQPPLIFNTPLTREERQLRLLELGRRAVDFNGTAGFAPLLPTILYLSAEQGFSDQDLPDYPSDLIKLLRRHEKDDNLPSAENVINLLGYGRGLTPSGDDVILGFLLALNRWGEVLLPTGDLAQLNQQVVAAAYKKTTTLSANLIECAARGLADERLINALDWLMSESTEESTPSNELFSWGSSSGIDVFLGFVLALSYKTNLIN
jgi:hypothetical protein